MSPRAIVTDSNSCESQTLSDQFARRSALPRKLTPNPATGLTPNAAAGCGHSSPKAWRGGHRPKLRSWLRSLRWIKRLRRTETPAVYFFDHERKFDRPRYAAGSSSRWSQSPRPRTPGSQGLESVTPFVRRTVLGRNFCPLDPFKFPTASSPRKECRARPDDHGGPSPFQTWSTSARAPTAPAPATALSGAGLAYQRRPARPLQPCSWPWKSSPRSGSGACFQRRNGGF